MTRLLPRNVPAIMRIRDILKRKGSNTVYSIAPSASLADVVAELIARRVGSLLVLDTDEGLVGIITEREIVRSLNREGGRWETLRATDVMSANVFLGALDDQLETTMELMTRRRVRHLPVMDGDTLAGLLSLGDIIEAALNESRFQNQLMKSYISNWPGEG